MKKDENRFFSGGGKGGKLESPDTFHRLKTGLGYIYIYSIEGIPIRICFSPERRNILPDAEDPSPRVLRVMQALLGFLEGGEVEGSLVDELLDSPTLTSFQKKVYRVTASIPRGRTLSYGEVADRAGHPRAARAVGNAMRRNPFPLIIPCHRVVRSDGRLGGYSGPPGMKERLLALEGVEIYGEYARHVARDNRGS